MILDQASGTIPGLETSSGFDWSSTIVHLKRTMAAQSMKCEMKPELLIDNLNKITSHLKPEHL